MAQLKIPDRYRSGIAKIISLSDESKQELRTALAKASPSSGPKALSASLASKVKTVSSAELDNIIPALFSLFQARDFFNLSTSDFVELLSKTMSRSGDDRLKLTGDAEERFKAYLIEVLDLELLNIGTKVFDLGQEYDHVACHMRVLTDIRPVFGANLDTTPPAAVINHTLRIAYHQGGKYKEFYVVLDGNQVESLKELLDRATQKAKTLETALNAAGMTQIKTKHHG